LGTDIYCVLRSFKVLTIIVIRYYPHFRGEEIEELGERNQVPEAHPAALCRRAGTEL
jgi:hypothetical protein